MFLLAKKLIYGEFKKKTLLISRFVVNRANLSKVQIKDVVSRTLTNLPMGKEFSFKVRFQCRF